MKRSLLKPLLALAALLAVVLAGRQAYPSHAAREEILEALGEMAKPYLLKLSRDIHTYHYRLGQVQYLRPDVPNRVKKQNASTRWIFRNPKDRNTPPYRHVVKKFGSWLGNGLYTATDPAISRVYAAPDYLNEWVPNFTHPWFMFRVILPKGAKVLDIPPYKMRIPAKHVELLKDLLDCDISDSTDPSLYDMFVVNTERRHGCRVLVNELLEKLDVTAIMYPFGSYYLYPNQENPLHRLPSCKRAPPRAFIITGDLPGDASMRAFSQVLPDRADNAEAERLAIQAAYAVLRPDAAPEYLWPELASLNPGATAADEYAREHYFGCGDHEDEWLRYPNNQP